MDCCSPADLTDEDYDYDVAAELTEGSEAELVDNCPTAADLLDDPEPTPLPASLPAELVDNCPTAAELSDDPEPTPQAVADSFVRHTRPRTSTNPKTIRATLTPR